ncbi:DUF1844 domain-containing protein [bacterium]|nr:DUF1844 domain-containing protein [bacterium]
MSRNDGDGSQMKHQELFVGLVFSILQSGMAQLGKTANPMTGKVEKNLEQAQYSIGMLEMLKARTEGNLQRDEQVTLDTALTNLRLNYVDEAKRNAEEPKADDSVKEELAEDQPNETPESD